MSTTNVLPSTVKELLPSAASATSAMSPRDTTPSAAPTTMAASRPTAILIPKSDSLVVGGSREDNGDGRSSGTPRTGAKFSAPHGPDLQEFAEGGPLDPGPAPERQRGFRHACGTRAAPRGHRRRIRELGVTGLRRGHRP